MGCGQSELTESEISILRLGELVHNSDTAANKQPGTGHPFLIQAAQHLHRIDDEERDNYAILVYSRHGKQYMLEKDLPRAIDSYTQAINLAEVKIAQRCRGLYLMLQRYSECMTDIARIWIGSAKGELNSSINPEKTTTPPSRGKDGNPLGADDMVSQSSAPLDSSLSTQDLVRKASINSTNSATSKRRKRDEATAEIVLLRCIETIEEGHNRRSDLLLDPLLQLSALYEGLHLYARAELLVRRCIGILIVQYGHDHPRLSESNQRLESLVVKKEEKNEEIAATNIQKTYRMHREMGRLADQLGRDVPRHTFDNTAHAINRTPTPPANFLQQLVGDDDDDDAEGCGQDGAGPTGEGSSTGHAQFSRNGSVNTGTTATTTTTTQSPVARGSFQSVGPNDGGRTHDADVGAGRATKESEELERLTQKPVNPVDAAMQAKPFRGVNADGNGASEQAAPKLWSVPGEYSDADGEEVDD